VGGGKGAAAGEAAEAAEAAEVAEAAGGVGGHGGAVGQEGGRRRRLPAGERGCRDKAGRRRRGGGKTEDKFKQMHVTRISC
jgi:hypothetical protein